MGSFLIELRGLFHRRETKIDKKHRSHNISRKVCNNSEDEDTASRKKNYILNNEIYYLTTENN